MASLLAISAGLAACAHERSEPLRISDLIELDKITPGAADASRVMIRLHAGEMPAPISGLPPTSDVDVRWLASFIDTLAPGEALICPQP